VDNEMMVANLVHAVDMGKGDVGFDNPRRTLSNLTNDI
jgi:hypothetical protein